ncbi:MAG: hypothetical protein ABGF52_00550 [Candidatus Asgardarchaeum sp.]
MFLEIITRILTFSILALFLMLIRLIYDEVKNVSVDNLSLLYEKKQKIITMAIRANIVFLLFYFSYLGFPLATIKLFEGGNVPRYWYVLGLLLFVSYALVVTRVFKLSERRENTLIFSNKFQDYTIVSDVITSILAALILAAIAGGITLVITIFIVPDVTPNPYLLAAFIVLVSLSLLTPTLLLLNESRFVEYPITFFYLSAPLFIISFNPTSDVEQIIFYMYAIAPAFVWMFLGMEEFEEDYSKDELIDYGFMRIDDEPIYLDYSNMSLKKYFTIMCNDAIFGFLLVFLLFGLLPYLASTSSSETFSLVEYILLITFRIALLIISIVLYESLFHLVSILNLKILNLTVTKSLIDIARNQNNSSPSITLKFDYDLNLGDDTEAALLLNLDSWIRFLIDDVKYNSEENEFTLTINKDILEYWIREVKCIASKIPNLTVDKLIEIMDFSRNQAFFLLSILKQQPGADK